MMKKYLLMSALLVSQYAMAAQLSLAEFKQQTNLQYADLELKQAHLNTALDQKKHPQILIEKACAYSTGLKRLKAFAQANRHLDYAKEEFTFIGQLDENFNQSLEELGTSYNKSCIQ